MLDFIIFAGTFLAVLIIAIIWLYPGAKNVTTIPGLLPSRKEDGNLGDMARAGSLHEFLMDIHSRFGNITGFWWGQTYVVSIASPELFKEHSSVFDRPPLLFKAFEPMIGSKSIQYANGADGRSRRRNYDHQFSFEHVNKYLAIFEEIALKTETKWLQKGKDDHIPINEDSVLFSIKSALVSLLGEYFKEDSTCLDFKKSYDRMWHEMEHSIVHGSPPDDQRQEQFDKSRDFLRSAIKEVVSYRRKNELHLQGNLLIDMLIEKSADDEIIEADAISYLVGGFHTTGNLLTWALYFLATHKDVQDKLYKEVYKIIGDKGSIDEHNVSEFVYINQVIDETLRCAVIAPWAARYQDFDTELGGHRIPKNTPVIQALGVTLKDKTLWPLPNKFDPDRFSPENRKKMSNYDFVPFGFAGKRKCPGYRFAYWDAMVFLAIIVRRFDINMCEDQVVTPVYGLVTSPAEEIWVKVTKRK